MVLAEILSRIAAELALFAGVGFLLFAVNDLLVDLIYFGAADVARGDRLQPLPARLRQRAAGVRRSPASSPSSFPPGTKSAVIASMLRATLQRLEYPNYRIFVGHYRNDPATAAAIASVRDERIEAVQVDADGPTTKADCLNHLYDALIAYETPTGRAAKAVVLHDAEDVVHPLELALFDRLIDRAGVIQLPVLPLIDPARAGSAAIIATSSPRRTSRNWWCARRSARRSRWPGSAARSPASRSPAWPRMHDGRPFAGASMTEDYEMGLRLGALGLKTMFVRIPAEPGEPRGGRQPRPFPGEPRRRGPPEGALARRHRLRRLGPARLARRARRALDADARPARAARRAAAGRRPMRAAFLWSQMWLAEALGAPVQARLDPTLVTLAARSTPGCSAGGS